MTTQKTKLLTADDLLRLYSQGIRGELVRGELHRTMPTGREHGELVVNVGFLLGTFVRPRRLGVLFGSDSGIWLERDPDTVREPDIGFISAARAPSGVRVKGYSEEVPDLVVEVVSPSDSAREANERALMWKGFEVRLVWMVFPDTRTVDVYGEDGSVTTLGEGDELDGGDVLPGFSCAVREIFEI